MNSEQEDFENLRKLLALKKYEQPPPRYFSELPSRIWVRIERGDGRATSFWARLLPGSGLSPAMAYSFGLLACGTLVFGIGYSLRTDPGQTAGSPLANGNNLLSTAPRLATTREPSGLNLSNFQPAQLASTNPVMNHSEPLPSLFNSLPLPQTAPVNYSPGQ